MPTVSVSNAVSQEADGQFLSYEVTLSEAALDTVTLDYRALAGTGESADLNWSFDRLGRTYGTVEFAPGITSQTIQIEANSDTLDERDESIILQLTNLSDNADFDNGEDTLRATGVILDNDGVSSNLALFVSDPIIVEGDSGTKEAVFEVRLSQAAPSDFTASYRTKDITANAGDDYVAQVGTLSFNTGDEVKFVRVPVLGDGTAEITERFSLVVEAPAGLTVGTDGLAGEATILDDDTDGITVVSIVGATTAEADGQYMAFEVRLSQPALDTVVFNYRAFEGTASSTDTNWDFDRLDRTYGTVEIPPGKTSTIIYIEANSDTSDERDESLTLQLTNLTENASFAGGEDQLRATGVILDNDGTGPNLALLVSSPVLVEGDNGAKDAVFEVRLSQPATSEVSVTYTTRDITAIAGEDYIATTGTLVFAPGEQSRAVKVSVLGDAQAETTESFALVVDAPASPSVGVGGLAGEATIRDDDTGAGPVVSIANAVATEADAQYMSFEVTLSEPSLETVRFDYRALAGTGGSYDLNWNFNRQDRTLGSVAFAPGETSAIIYIEANRDTADERDESIVLKLTNLSETASFAGGGDALTATGIIHDNDGSGSNLALLVSDVTLLEGDSGTRQAEFIVSLSQPLGADLTVNYSTRDVTALAGEDYVARSGSLTFAAGEQHRAVRVNVLGDETAEFTESFTLLLQAPDSVSLSESGLAGQAVIHDDDTTPGPVITVSDASAAEADGQLMAFEVTLSEASNAPVSLSYRALEGTGGSGDLNWGLDSAGRTVGSITFDPGTLSKLIYIEANSDSLDERDETIFLELSNAVGGSFAGGAPTTQAVGFLLDDDGLGPNRILTVAPTMLREQGVAVADYEIPVIMSQTASVELSFDVAALDRSAVAGIDYRLLDSSVTFLPGETRASVSVQVLGDAADEVTETFALSLTPQEGVPFVGVIPAGEVTILNGPRIPTEGDDVLVGTSDPDEINLLRGNDSYMGLAGDDTVRGGGGDDTIIGGSGEDLLQGQSGNDFLVGGISTNDINSYGGQVYRIYRATLDRAPDTGGFGGWIAELAEGTTDIFEVTRGFVASKEFQNVYGNLDNTAFVTLLYNNVLGREPDAGGLTGWLQQLAGGTSREQVVIGFSESVEFKEVTGIAASAYTNTFEQRALADYLDDVFRLYRATLDRAPDQAGLEGWSSQLATGLSYVSIAGGFTNSTEFRNTYGAVDDRGFVNLLYRNVLDRNADDTGLGGWLSQIANGLSREGVVRGFAQSREFVNKTDAAFTAYMKDLEGDTFIGGSGSDTLAGGYAADVFEFDASADGSDVVLQINPWDTVRFRGFGYDNAEDALAHMVTLGSDVRFSDEGVQILFAGADLALMEDVEYGLF